MRHTLSTLRRAAAKHGGTLDVCDVGRTVDVNIDAPDGKLWACDELHWLCVSWHKGMGEHSGKHEYIADAIERMARGVVDCPDAECEVCHPDGGTA
jgi:hypothetical protein